jgi:hypothetical protein
MKIIGIIISTLAMFFMSPVMAQQDTCIVWGEIAAKIMASRQDGKPPSYWMEKLVKPEQSADMNQFMTSVILGAYDLPRYGNKSDKAAAIQDYRSAMEAVCYDAK